MMPENSDGLRMPRGQPVFSAETDISISENPNLRFYFVPVPSGDLRAEITDADGARFTKTLTVAPPLRPIDRRLPHPVDETGLLGLGPELGEALYREAGAGGPFRLDAQGIPGLCLLYWI
jgi:hypothetical protein